jgi:methylated-DNA-[protein]-cysteine S-methyltransferase
MSAPAPLGLLFLARTERGLRYLRFMDRRSLKRVLTLLAAENPGAEWHPSLLELKPVVDQLDAYFSGLLQRFNVPLDPLGTEFQLQVWRELSRIPFAATRSYGAVAQAIGQPRSARAVGLANNQNPIAIIVPCHRVVGADGSLTGYGGGLPRKRWLLEHERRFGELETRTERSRPAIVHVPPAPPVAKPGRRRAPKTAPTRRPGGGTRATGTAAAARAPRRATRTTRITRT